jgi:membrane protease YdiL (CAAX protease family)
MVSRGRMTKIEKPVSERKIWGPWATVGLGLAVIAVFVAVQIVVVIAFIINRLLPYLQSAPGQLDFYELANTIEALVASQLGLITAITAVASSVICVILIIVFARLRKDVGITEYLGLNRITGKQVLAVLGIMAGFIVLSDGLGFLLGKSTSNEFVVNVYSTSVWPALLWVSLIIFVPIFEETFFRGFVFEGFRQSRLGPIGAVGITALAWASLHIQYGIYEIAVIFVLGILFGIVRIKTGSLWSTLIMHAFTNMVALVQVTLYLEGLIG